MTLLDSESATERMVALSACRHACANCTQTGGPMPKGRRSSMPRVPEPPVVSRAEGKTSGIAVSSGACRVSRLMR